jgi:hypothetical protein
MTDVLKWLLEEGQPSIRYLTLTQLLDKPQSDPDVTASRAMITTTGWAAEILSKQASGGWWVAEENLYRPKYMATNWMLLALSDLGLTRVDPRISKACDLWIRRFAKSDGGFGVDNARKSELCVVGNTARALVKFGYEDHPKVKNAFRWLVRKQRENGGWHCWGRNGVIDAWEGMSAFAVYPKQKWTRSIKRAVERGVEFYLSRELYRQGERYEPWFRFHYPEHYYYDLLVGLDFLSALGYGSDRRLKYATSFLMEKRNTEGNWNLDAVHPDVEGSVAKWYRKWPPVPLALEQVGQPSKMITLKALRVLKRINGSLPQ